MQTLGPQRSIGLHRMNSVTVLLKASLDHKTFEKQLKGLLPAKGAIPDELAGTVYRIKALALLDGDVHQVRLGGRMPHARVCRGTIFHL